jgi:hypothetical protein
MIDQLICGFAPWERWYWWPGCYPGAFSFCGFLAWCAKNLPCGWFSTRGGDGPEII